MSVDSARPVIERIMSLVYDRLNIMTTGIYPNSPVCEVVRNLRTETYSPKSYQIILVLSEQENIEELTKPGNPPSVAHLARIHVYCHVMPSETDTTPFEEYCSAFYADCIEALTDSGDANWWRWGNYAIDSRYGAMQNLDSDGGVDGFMIQLEINYRVLEW